MPNIRVFSNIQISPMFRLIKAIDEGDVPFGDHDAKDFEPFLNVIINLTLEYDFPILGYCLY